MTNSRCARAVPTQCRWRGHGAHVARIAEAAVRATRPSARVPVVPCRRECDNGSVGFCLNCVAIQSWRMALHARCVLGHEPRPRRIHLLWSCWRPLRGTVHSEALVHSLIATLHHPAVSWTCWLCHVCGVPLFLPARLLCSNCHAAISQSSISTLSRLSFTSALTPTVGVKPLAMWPNPFTMQVCFDSTMRKRARKMNKHKYRKLRKKLRFVTKANVKAQ